MLAFLAGQRARQEARAEEIGRRLEKCLIPGTYEEAKQLAGDAAVTRAHFARVLVARGVADNMQKVFKKYLSRGNKGYVPAEWPGMGRPSRPSTPQAGWRAGSPQPLQSHRQVDQAAAGGLQGRRGCHGRSPLPQQSPQERANLGQWAREARSLYFGGVRFSTSLPAGPSLAATSGSQGGMPLWLGHPSHFGLTPEACGPAGQPLTPGRHL